MSTYDRSGCPALGAFQPLVETLREVHPVEDPREGIPDGQGAHLFVRESHEMLEIDDPPGSLESGGKIGRIDRPGQVVLAPASSPLRIWDFRFPRVSIRM